MVFFQKVRVLKNGLKFHIDLLIKSASCSTSEGEHGLFLSYACRV